MKDSALIMTYKSLVTGSPKHRDRVTNSSKMIVWSRSDHLFSVFEEMDSRNEMR